MEAEQDASLCCKKQKHKTKIYRVRLCSSDSKCNSDCEAVPVCSLLYSRRQTGTEHIAPLYNPDAVKRVVYGNVCKCDNMEY